MLCLFLYFRLNEPDTTAPTVLMDGSRSQVLEQCIGVPGEEILMLALSPTCSWCAASYPFYKKITDRTKSGDLRLGVVAVVDTSASVRVQRLQLEDAGVSADSVVVCPLRAAGVSSVPTVVYFDQNGVASAVWTGFFG